MVFDADFCIDLSKPGWMESQLSKNTIEKVSQDQNMRIDYAARYISLMIANICNVLDIENVIVGGEIVEEMGDALIDRTNTYLEHLSMFPVILTRSVSSHSGLIGAASMAMDKELTTILADNE
jgi:predicted NBD/HSP70 family sugar kinase